MKPAFTYSAEDNIDNFNNFQPFAKFEREIQVHFLIDFSQVSPSSLLNISNVLSKSRVLKESEHVHCKTFTIVFISQSINDLSRFSEINI